MVANLALKQLYEADQADRMHGPINRDRVSRRDRERRSEVRRLLAAGEVLDGWDHYWAAVVLIHSHDTQDLESAHELSSRAVELESEPLQIRALYPVTKDRLLLSRGDPQWYGTQKIVVDGEIELAPINLEAVTDEERQVYGVLTLEERYREIDRINRTHAKRQRAEREGILHSGDKRSRKEC